MRIVSTKTIIVIFVSLVLFSQVVSAGCVCGYAGGGVYACTSGCGSSYAGRSCTCDGECWGGDCTWECTQDSHCGYGKCCGDDHKCFECCKKDTDCPGATFCTLNSGCPSSLPYADCDCPYGMCKNNKCVPNYCDISFCTCVASCDGNGNDGPTSCNSGYTCKNSESACSSACSGSYTGYSQDCTSSHAGNDYCCKCTDGADHQPTAPTWIFPDATKQNCTNGNPDITFDTTPTISWTPGTDPDGEQVITRLWVGDVDSSSCALDESNGRWEIILDKRFTTETSYTLSGVESLTEGKTYKFYLCSKDADLSQDWSKCDSGYLKVIAGSTCEECTSNGFEWCNRGWLGIKTGNNDWESLSRKVDLPSSGYAKIVMIKQADYPTDNAQAFYIKQDDNNYYKFSWSGSGYDSQGIYKVVGGNTVDSSSMTGTVDTDGQEYTIEMWWDPSFMRLDINGRQRKSITTTDTTELNPTSFTLKSSQIDLGLKSIEIYNAYKCGTCCTLYSDTGQCCSKTHGCMPCKRGLQPEECQKYGHDYYYHPCGESEQICEECSEDITSEEYCNENYGYRYDYSPCKPCIRDLVFSDNFQDQGLVAHWDMDENSGSIVRDSSGYDNDGEWPSSRVNWVQGKYGSALEFDGVDDYVEVPGSDSLDLTKFTVSLWIKPDALGTGSWQGIIGKGTGDKNNRNYALFQRLDDDRLHYSFSDGNDWVSYSSVGSLTIGDWYYVVMTYDQANFCLYINGEKDSCVPESRVPLTTSESLYIGRLPDYGAFNGAIDDVRIYNRALSAGEIKSLYESGQYIWETVDTKLPANAHEWDSGECFQSCREGGAAGKNCFGTCITNPEDCGAGPVCEGVRICGQEFYCGNNTDGICPADYGAYCPPEGVCCDLDCGPCGPVVGGGRIIAYTRYPEIEAGITDVIKCSDLVEGCNNPYINEESHSGGWHCSDPDYAGMMSDESNIHHHSKSSVGKKLQEYRNKGYVKQQAIVFAQEIEIEDAVPYITRGEMVDFLVRGIINTTPPTYCDEYRCSASFDVIGDSGYVYEDEPLDWDGWEEAWHGQINTSKGTENGCDKAEFKCEEMYTLIVKIWSRSDHMINGTDQTDFYISCEPRLKVKPLKVSLALGERDKNISNVVMINPRGEGHEFDLSLDEQTILSWVGFTGTKDNLGDTITLDIPCISQDETNIYMQQASVSGSYDLKVSSDCSDSECSAAGPWSDSKIIQVNVFSASITEFQSEQYAVLLGLVLLIIVGIA
ncbi:MAG: hypothetical protein J7K31_04395 [Candidatus Aenigmarchaeota archaeon]|nr:hypothetical protein [Candidatus Aenigmarchaeota archaeon]